MNMMTGECLCGAVKFTAEGTETDYHACHCGMCRRWAGGPFLGVSVGRLNFEGNKHIARYDSSDWAQRGFCRKCGTNLFYYLKAGDRYVLPVGAFDDAEAFRLVGEIYVDHQPPGYRFAGDLSRMTEAEFLAHIGAGTP